MKTDLYNVKNEKIGTVELPDGIFGYKWNADLVHQALTAQTANRRVNLAHAKGRGEVRGGGKKPWRQKGTGRARHGSTRSPIWAHGGVSHGPVKTQDFSKKINKKMKRLALFSALSRKFKEGGLKVVEALTVSEPKTRLVAGIVKQFGVGSRPSFLVIPKTGEKNIYRGASNLPNAKAIAPETLNVYDVIKYKTVLLDKDAVEAIQKTYKV